PEPEPEPVSGTTATVGIAGVLLAPLVTITVAATAAAHLAIATEAVVRGRTERHRFLLLRARPRRLDRAEVERPVRELVAHLCTRERDLEEHVKLRFRLLRDQRAITFKVLIEHVERGLALLDRAGDVDDLGAARGGD